MGLVPNPEFMRIYTKVTQVFLMLKLPYPKRGVGVLKTGFLARQTRMGGPH